MVHLNILHQCGKKVKTTSQKVLGANSNVCRSYRGKTARGEPHPLQISDSDYEKKDTQNEHAIAHFEYFFT